MVNKKKAVLIAKDVLKFLDSKKIDPSTGHYFESLELNTVFGNGRVSTKCSLKSLLQVLKEPCTVCALGSLFYARVARYNDAMVGDIYDPDGMADILGEYFTTENLAWIEAAFEGGYHFATECISFDEVELTSQWLYKEAYEDEEDRLRSILHNIIRNGGEFVMPRKYLREAKNFLFPKCG